MSPFAKMRTAVTKAIQPESTHIAVYVSEDVEVLLLEQLKEMHMIREYVSSLQDCYMAFHGLPVEFNVVVNKTQLIRTYVLTGEQ